MASESSEESSSDDCGLNSVHSLTDRLRRVRSPSTLLSAHLRYCDQIFVFRGRQTPYSSNLYAVERRSIYKTTQLY